MGESHEEETSCHQGLPRETFQELYNHETPDEEGYGEGSEVVNHGDGIHLQVQRHDSRDDAVDHADGENSQDERSDTGHAKKIAVPCVFLPRFRDLTRSGKLRQEISKNGGHRGDKEQAAQPY